jgi:hypothetical protein
MQQDPKRDVQERIDAIADRVVLLTQQAQELGEAGKIEDSQMCLCQIEQLRRESEQFARGDLHSLAGPPGERKMMICETCGAFLVVGDTEKRQRGHLDGKQHQGYALIRATIAELRARLSAASRDRDRHDSCRAVPGRASGTLIVVEAVTGPGTETKRKRESGEAWGASG